MGDHGRKKQVGLLQGCLFVFDGVLVFVTVVETWMLPVFFAFLGGKAGVAISGNSSTFRLMRLLRLTKMARMVRLLRAVPELVVLTNAIFSALRTVAVTFGLLLIIIYV